MKKLLSLALVLIMVLAFAVPAMAAPAGFVDGTVVTIDKNGYDSFDGTEITANNSNTVFDSFKFVADNKSLNAWYIDVAEDVNGTLEVAYKVGSNYYVVTFDIDGAGKYFIADSKGSNGANMVKIGVFVENEEPQPVSILRVFCNFSNSSHSMPQDEFDALIVELLADGMLPINLTNGWGVDGVVSDVQYREACFDLYADQLVEIEVVEPYYEFTYKGNLYAYSLDLNTGRPVSFIVEKVNGNYIDYEYELMVEVIKLPIAQPTTYVLGINGGTNGFWATDIKSGDSVVFDGFECDAYPIYEIDSARIYPYFFVVFDKQDFDQGTLTKIPEVTFGVGFGIDEKGDFEFVSNPWFDLVWNGGSVVTITFTLE